MKKHYRTENDCLNCGTLLQGRFCFNCGQENLEVKESFGHMMNHAVSDYFHFDHQFFHTLKPLFFKPGFLTNEYMAGRRAQYLHPVKMYIFISLVYFLLLFTGRDIIFKGHPVKVSTKFIADSVNTIKAGKTKKNNSTTLRFNKDTTYAGYLSSQLKLPPAKREGWLQQYFTKKSYALRSSKFNIKELVEEGLKHNFPKVMFLLLPFFAFLIGIAFRNNKKFYVEHLIFSFHLHCFVFLFLALVMLLRLFIPADLVIANSFINNLSYVFIIIYVYLAFRAVYQRSYWRTFTKMTGITIVYGTVFLFCFVSVITVSLLMAV